MDACYMSETTKAELRKPSEQFGKALADLAIKTFGTNAEALKAAGYTPKDKNETLRRLRKGEATERVARSVLKALEREGADTSSLPPMYPDEVPRSVANWQEEWTWIGE